METQTFLKVRAEVRLLPSLANGRRLDWRPNHNFFNADGAELTGGRIQFEDGFELRPGESNEVIVDIWWSPKLEGQIYPGREWQIQEGPHLVGFGRVIEVLDRSTIEF